MRTLFLHMKCAAVASCKHFLLSSAMWVTRDYINVSCKRVVSFYSQYSLLFYLFASQSVDLDMKHDCKPLMERINVFKTAFTENEDDER